jgi:hypothetical protein
MISFCLQGQHWQSSENTKGEQIETTLYALSKEQLEAIEVSLLLKSHNMYYI